MIHCTVAGCKEIASELLTPDNELAKWRVIRACRCGAYDARNQKSCTCTNEGPIPITYWPNLDWYAFGGVDEVVLCPRHRKEVFDEIVGQRQADPSMNSDKRNPGNVH